MTSVCKWLGFYFCSGYNALPTALIEMAPTKRKAAGALYEPVVTYQEIPANNGVSFDILFENATSKMPNIAKVELNITQETIDLKMNESEERRRSVELNKLSSANTCLLRVDEAKCKALILNNSFSDKAQKNMNEKLANNELNREMHSSAKKEKIINHLAHVKDVGDKRESVREVLKEHINERQHLAFRNRNDYISDKKEKLEEHSKHVGNVIYNKIDNIKTIEAKCVKKMVIVQKNRDDILADKAKKLKLKDIHSKCVRQNKKNLENVNPISCL